MAKFCANCSKKISYIDRTYRLVHENIYFCQTCSEEVKKLLYDVKIMVNDAKYEQIQEQFLTDLEKSNYDNNVKRCIKREFLALAQTHVMKDVISAWRFAGGFDQSYAAIKKAAESAFDDYSSTGIVTAGDVKAAALIGSYTGLLNSAYITISVMLINRRGVSLIKICGANPDYNETYSLRDRFLKKFREINQDIDIEEIIGEKHLNFDDCVGFAALSANESPVTANRIGVLGGTFDPVHRGHISLAKAAIKEAGLSRLIVMPAYLQPFKQGKRVTDEEHRLAMTRLAFEGMKNVEISTLEIDRLRVSYTYDTLIDLQKKHPNHEIFFVTGADAFMDIESWYKGENLLKNFSFIVSIRPGYEINRLDEKIKKYGERYGTRVIKLNENMPDISSTDIREACRNGENISTLVPDAVERYIEDNGLYK